MFKVQLNIQSTFSESTLTSEQQAIVDLVNSLLASCSHDQDNQQTARRLAAYLLETGDVASQQEIATALGYESARTIRHICDQVEQEGLETLLNQVTGRPAVTTRVEVIQTTLGEILAAVINERDLPEDDELARRINRRLAQTDYDGEPVTARMVQTIRLQKGAWFKKLLFGAKTSLHFAQESCQSHHHICHQAYSTANLSHMWWFVQKSATKKCKAVFWS